MGINFPCPEFILITLLKSLFTTKHAGSGVIHVKPGDFKVPLNFPVIFMRFEVEKMKEYENG
jgi:hypothetical protein